ncbi:MAG: sporulation protein YqfD, partial [Clostridia bacterium]|nr:sporulation protein YqfD [Clostridia bacterium]
NEHMTVRQVREELATSGIYVGMLLDTFDPGECALQIQLCSENISWASINLSGTVAYVEIRERVPTPIEETILPANLVAGCEGVVEELEIYQGVPVVQSGQGVRQGDLLVSGVYDSQAVGWRVTRAAGRVLARTVREFTVEIPLEYEKKVYLDDASVKKNVIFFEKEIKLFKNSGILGVTCDKINSIDSFTLGEGVSLPISVRTEYSFPYEFRRAERSYEQAEAIAYDELQRSIAQAVPEGVLLRKVITTTLGEDAYVLHCRVWCLENIAQLQPFTVESLSR